MKAFNHRTLGLVTGFAAVVLGSFGAAPARAQDKDALIATR